MTTSFLERNTIGFKVAPVNRDDDGLAPKTTVDGFRKQLERALERQEALTMPGVDNPNIYALKRMLERLKEGEININNVVGKLKSPIETFFVPGDYKPQTRVEPKPHLGFSNPPRNKKQKGSES